MKQGAIESGQYWWDENGETGELREHSKNLDIVHHNFPFGGSETRTRDTSKDRQYEGSAKREEGKGGEGVEERERRRRGVGQGEEGKKGGKRGNLSDQLILKMTFFKYASINFSKITTRPSLVNWKLSNFVFLLQ